MELEQAKKLAADILNRLSPYCKKIQVAGSIRREKAFVKDIDVVLIPSDPWNLEFEIRNMARPFTPHLTGEKLKRFTYLGAQVDLYFATEDTWATLLLIRTGSKENNIKLASLAQKRGWKLKANGEGLFNEMGERVAGDTEESIYRALNVQYQEPRKRN